MKPRDTKDPKQLINVFNQNTISGTGVKLPLLKTNSLKILSQTSSKSPPKIIYTQSVVTTPAPSPSTIAATVATPKRQKYDVGEKITLNKRNLASIPTLKNQEKVKYLYLEYNFIAKLDRLVSFENLVSIDLFHNQIKTMENLSDLRSLRFVYLGNNNITKISGIENLWRLEVLDLKNNNIDRIENLSNLTNLRFLDLSGNNIRVVYKHDIENLKSLSDLNLSRNKITHIEGLQSLNLLKRIFLSKNLISSFLSIKQLFECKKVEELSLDGNYICESKFYRLVFIDRVPSLRLFDGKEVTLQEKDILCTIENAIVEPNFLVDFPIPQDESEEKVRPSTLVNSPVETIGSTVILRSYGVHDIGFINWMNIDGIKFESVPLLDFLSHHQFNRVSEVKDNILLLSFDQCSIENFKNLQKIAAIFRSLQCLNILNDVVLNVPEFDSFTCCLFPDLRVLCDHKITDTDRKKALLLWGNVNTFLRKTESLYSKSIKVSAETKKTASLFCEEVFEKLANTAKAEKFLEAHFDECLLNYAIGPDENAIDMKDEKNTTKTFLEDFVLRNCEIAKG